ncbi:MAG: CTP synthase [Defluviitaleaceae bacterium]|nr:CTP synthase [Defluviitaleaceae bacterium]
MQTQQKKYIFVTGGVASGLGKGVTAASLGRLLKARRYNVTISKFDPYFNIDPGTMSPYQHGEVFVTEDGGQTDLDIGHYERFIDENLNMYSNTTAGKIYWSVLEQEREGKYGGKTVQVIPHITDEIKNHIYATGEKSGADIVMAEIGGTVGDIEGLPFLEAIRQIRYEVGHSNVLYVHVPLIPRLSRSDEMKSKPAQHSVKELLSLGIQPDIIVCRTEWDISDDMRDKLALFCNVKKECVIQNSDCDLIYEVPLMFERQKLAQIACSRLGLEEDREADLSNWQQTIDRWKKLKNGNSVKIALVGTYVELHDAYLSVSEALLHAGIGLETGVVIDWVDAEALDAQNADELLAGADGVIAPGDIGENGTEGIIAAVKYAHGKGIPMLGINLGMQCMLLQRRRAADPMGRTDESLFCNIPEGADEGTAADTARLGARRIDLQAGTLAARIYENKHIISERHRHRQIFDNSYRAKLEATGIVFSGTSGDIVEVIELPQDGNQFAHPFFVGVQFHPEFKSRPNRPHPIFTAFIEASVGNR